jgi:hypothetical protein
MLCQRLASFSFVFRMARKMRILCPIFTVFLLVTPGSAQQAPERPTRPDPPPYEQASPQRPAQNPPSGESPVTLPTGTQFALVLTHPIDSKVTHRGDPVYGQITDPVLVDNQVVIPAGTFLQGKVEKLTRQGTRAELWMQSAALAFPDGYVAKVSGPVEIKGGEGTAWINPSSGAKTGALLAPLIGSGLGTAIGLAAHTTQTTNFAGMTMTSDTPKGMAIGSITGLAAGAVVSFVLLARSHPFYIQEGAPLEMVLEHPVTLARGPVDDATGAVAQR